MVLPDGRGLEMHAPPRGGVVATRRGVATGVLRPGGEPRAQNANDRQNQWTVHEHEVDYGGTLPPTIDCDSQMSTRDDRSGPWSGTGVTHRDFSTRRARAARRINRRDRRAERRYWGFRCGVPRSSAYRHGCSARQCACGDRGSRRRGLRN